jgi:hypothetical protein
MKSLKECCFGVLIIIILSVFLVNCKEAVGTDAHLERKILDSNYKTERLKTNIRHALTSEQLSFAFPNQLSGLKKTHVQLDQNGASATAFYGNNQYQITIIDDLENHYSNIRSFYRRYRNLDSTKAIASVRDGYKTITIIRPEIEITSISFVFKKRYLIHITGTNKTPYMVWRFLELNKLKKLQE